MSSATSTEFQPWQLFTLAGLLGATVVVLVSTGQTPAGIILLSLIIFAAAVVGVAAWRAFAPLAGGDRPGVLRTLGGRKRSVIEREKALVLRSIKELEFDHAMGKVSPKDFAEMQARLRLRAAGLIRQLDAGRAYREQIEGEVARRVGARPARPAAAVADARPASAACASCGTLNDVDARFCKQCGTQVGSTA